MLTEFARLGVYYMLAYGYNVEELRGEIEKAIDWIESHPKAGAEITMDEIVDEGVVIESPSGWKFREEQENGDQVDCWTCGKPLDDNYPIVNDARGFAYHPDCLTEEG